MTKAMGKRTAWWVELTDGERVSVRRRENLTGYEEEKFAGLKRADQFFDYVGLRDCWVKEIHAAGIAEDRRLVIVSPNVGPAVERLQALGWDVVPAGRS